jgi:hypothetical protein
MIIAVSGVAEIHTGFCRTYNYLFCSRLPDKRVYLFCQVQPACDQKTGRVLKNIFKKKNFSVRMDFLLGLTAGEMEKTNEKAIRIYIIRKRVNRIGRV